MRILIVGASGYIGARLARRLEERGHDLVLMSRDARPLAARFPTATTLAADLLDPSTLPRAVADVEVAYYLAHSMGVGGAGLAERDRQAAHNFGVAAAAAGVRRIIYLGSLGNAARDRSHHLASRHNVGEELAAHGVPVTEIRTGVLIGSGSAAFEMLRYLVERQPVMLTPRWVGTRCQPISVHDVFDYLTGALDHPELTGVVEVGGPEVLTFREMLRVYARKRGLRRLILSVPVQASRLSSYWVSLIAPMPAGFAWPLIEDLRSEVVVRDPGPASAFDVHPMPFAAALQRAIDRTGRQDVESTWFDSLGSPSRESLSSVTSYEGMLVDRRQREVAAPPERVFAEVERLGGRAGWPYLNVLWRIRGLMDRAVGGVGMRLGRRDPDHLRVGDALDFWRVEEVDRPRTLRLRAEMKVPGRAWLQYEVIDTGSSCRLVQTAYFAPRGVAGRAYWYLLYPIHDMIFRGTVRVLAARALGQGPAGPAKATEPPTATKTPGTG